MSKIILYLGISLITVNTLIGLLISNYSSWTCFVVNVILIIHMLLLLALFTNKITNGYKISLLFIYLFLGLVSIVLALLSPLNVEDNYYLVGFICILLIEISLYLIAMRLKLETTSIDRN